MSRSIAVTTMLMSLALLASGASLAQSPSPPVPTLTPAPSYQPLPAVDPVAAVDAWLDALVAGQWTRLPALTCRAERSHVASFYGVSLSESGHHEMQGFNDAMQPEIVDRSVTLGAISGDTATVIIGGTFVYVDLEAELRPFVIDAYTADGEASPSPEQIDANVTAYADYIRQFALPPEATVVREDGGWLTCTRLQVHVDPSPAP